MDFSSRTTGMEKEGGRGFGVVESGRTAGGSRKQNGTVKGESVDLVRREVGPSSIMELQSESQSQARMVRCTERKEHSCWRQDLAAREVTRGRGGRGRGEEATGQQQDLRHP